MQPTYRELQATMRDLKAQGKTAIPLTSSYHALMAEFVRIEEPIEVSLATDGEPGEDSEPTDIPVEVAPPEGLWERLIALIPSRPTAELFRRNCILSSITIAVPLDEPIAPIRDIRLKLSIYSQSMETLLRKRAFMLEAAYFQLTGNLATVLFVNPNPWTQSTPCLPNPTAPKCTRSSWPPFATVSNAPSTTNSYSHPKCPTSANQPISIASASTSSTMPSPGSTPLAMWR